MDKLLTSEYIYSYASTLQPIAEEMFTLYQTGVINFIAKLESGRGIIKGKGFKETKKEIQEEIKPQEEIKQETVENSSEKINNIDITNIQEDETKNIEEDTK